MNALYGRLGNLCQRLAEARDIPIGSIDSAEIYTTFPAMQESLQKLDLSNSEMLTLAGYGDNTVLAYVGEDPKLTGDTYAEPGEVLLAENGLVRVVISAGRSFDHDKLHFLFKREGKALAALRGNTKYSVLNDTGRPIPINLDQGTDRIRSYLNHVLVRGTAILLEDTEIDDPRIGGSAITCPGIGISGGED